MLKFMRDRHRIVIDPMSLTIKPLMDIWISDPTEDKVEATKLLTYVHLVSQIDQNAPYAKVEQDEVYRLVKKELYGNYDHEFEAPYTEDKLDEVVLHYQSAFELPEEATVRSYNQKIYETKRLIDSTEIVIEKVVARGITTFVSNSPILNKMLLDVVKIAKARDEMKAIVVKQNTRDFGKANKKMSFLEKRRRDMADSKASAAKGEILEEKEPEPAGL